MQCRTLPRGVIRAGLAHPDSSVRLDRADGALGRGIYRSRNAHLACVGFYGAQAIRHKVVARALLADAAEAGVGPRVGEAAFAPRQAHPAVAPDNVLRLCPAAVAIGPGAAHLRFVEAVVVAVEGARNRAGRVPAPEDVAACARGALGTRDELAVYTASVFHVAGLARPGIDNAVAAARGPGRQHCGDLERGEGCGVRDDRFGSSGAYALAHATWPKCEVRQESRSVKGASLVTSSGPRAKPWVSRSMRAM